jgi:BirA family biotin operon repressor/biotin-[acetyl-CoA-carboxylase] ligase
LQKPESFSDICCSSLENIFRGSRHFSDHRISWVDNTVSTNDDLKAAWNHAPIPDQLRIADFQTGGRGQHGRIWRADAGQSLLFSFSLANLHNRFPLSLLTGLALCITLQHLVRDAGDASGLWLKWPNDIWLNRRKLAGILCESCVIGDNTHWVIGAGINLLPLNDLQTVSASFSEIADVCSRQKILCEFFSIIDELLMVDEQTLVEQWTRAAAVFWQTRFLVECHGQSGFYGLPQRLAPDGALLIKPDGNEKSRRLMSATLRPVY